MLYVYYLKTFIKKSYNFTAIISQKMLGKIKSTPKIDREQLELIENAHNRIKQKKYLYVHSVIFLIGSVFLIIANTVLGIGENFTILGKEWFLYAIMFWLIFLVYHAFNVFITNKFMGKAWEQRQLEKLVAKQQSRIEQIKEEFIKDDTLLAQTEYNKKIINSITNPELTIIVAAAENNAIGKDNKLIWHLSNDLKRFKKLTNNHHIIMGRKTFESFPKPLTNRIHIVITRQENYKVPDGVIVVNSLEAAINKVKGDEQPFIIGGGEIYKQAMAVADKIELTRVHETFDADTYFPEIDKSIWEETSNMFHSKDENHSHDYSFLTYKKR